MFKKMKHKVAMLFAFAFVLGIASITTTKQADAAGAYIIRNLKLNTTYYNYDVTGDGKADTIKLVPRVKTKYEYEGLRMLINGTYYQIACPGGYEVYYSASYEIVRLANGNVFVHIVTSSDNDDDFYQSLYQFGYGQMALALDFEAPVRFAGHTTTGIVDVTDNTITIKQNTQLPRIAFCELNYSYSYANGNFARTSKVAKITAYRNSPGYLKVKKSVTWYKNKECKKKKGTLKKSTYAKPLELYIGNKNISIKVKTKSGKIGWVKGPKRLNSSELIFKDVFFAG